MIKVIGKPYKSVYMGKGCTVYPCSDGVARRVTELAKMAKVACSTMSIRLKKYGPDYPDNLLDPNFGDIMRQYYAEQRNPNSKVLILSGKERRENLNKIPSPTEIEKKLWGG